MKIRLVLCALVLSLPSVSRSDSPLTSTTFSKAYLEDGAGREEFVEMLEEAATTKSLDEAMMKFLTDRGESPQAKLALVNALGWSLDGADDPNSGRFLEHVRDGGEGALGELSAEQLTIYGYLLALENYQGGEGLKAAHEALKLAREKDRASYVTNLALTLVECQLLFDADDWKGVWKRYLELEGDEELRDRLNEGAVEIVRDYLKLYE